MRFVSAPSHVAAGRLRRPIERPLPSSWPSWSSCLQKLRSSPLLRCSC